MKEHIENIQKVQSKVNVNCYHCEGKHLSQNCLFKDEECFNLVREAESNEDKVFNNNHQRVIRGKIAHYVANMEIEKHWSITNPSKTPPPTFSPSLLLNMQIVQAPFLGNHP